MNNLRLLILCSCLIFLPLAWAADESMESPADTEQAKGNTSSAPISIINGKFYVPCEFDEYKTTCLIDSGSSFSTVKSPRFDHYATWGHVRYNGGTGKEIEVDRIYVLRYTIAHLHLKKWPVARLPLQEGFMDIAGLDIFSKAPVLFDFKNRLIVFNPPLPQNVSPSPPFLDFGMLMVPVKIGHQDIYAVWDTGASKCVIDINYVKEHPNEFTFIKQISGTDATRTDIPMNLYTIKELTIGKASFKDVQVAAMDLSGMKKVHPNFPVFFLGYNVIAEHSWFFDLNKDLWGID